jgi:hypothetical protein
MCSVLSIIISNEISRDLFARIMTYVSLVDIINEKIDGDGY